MTKSRKQEREDAFVILFEQVIQKNSIEEILEDAFDARDLEITAFTKKMVLGAEENLEKLDKIIEKNLKGWTMRRISKVNLAVLRLAVYELMFEEKTPIKVVINEAVELAKKYAGEKDASYANGILGSVVKMRENPELLEELDAREELEVAEAEDKPEKKSDEILSSFANEEETGNE